MQILIKLRKLCVTEGARSQSKFPSLFDGGIQNLRMAMALVQCRVGRKTVQVTFALCVIDPNAFASLKHHVQRIVVMSSIFFLQLDVVSGQHRSSLASHYRSLQRRSE